MDIVIHQNLTSGNKTRILNTTHSIEEKELVARSIRGDSRAQVRLYKKYVKAMYNIVIRMIPEQMDAEDVVQESFVKVFKNLKSFKGDSTLGAWIKRITINTALNFIRKNKKMRFVAIENEDKLTEETANDNTPRVDMKTIHNAIKKLPQGCRVILSLYLLEGYQHKEIAVALDISESTSKTQFQRAKRLLRNLIKKD